MKLSKHQLAILALITSNIIWGAAPPIFKWSLVDIPPFTLAFLRFFFAAVIILPLIANKLAIKREDVFKIFILAFFVIIINITFFFFGLLSSVSFNFSFI